MSNMRGNITKVRIKTDDLMSVPQAARVLGKPKLTLYRWIAKGKITAIELGDVLFIPTKEVERLQGEKQISLRG